MSSGKKGCLAFYAVLALLSVVFAGGLVGTVANWLIVLLVAVHLLEVVVFFKLCKDAGGSLPGHLLNVFIFGYLHTQELKAAQS